MKIVKVVWNDARCFNSNLTIDEIKKLGLIETETIGYLIDENKERVAIASTIFKEINGDLDNLFNLTFLTFRDVSLIPKSQIIKIIELIMVKK